MPPWSSDLPSLGAVDSGPGARPTLTATTFGRGVSVPGSTTAGSTPVTTRDRRRDEHATATTEPAGTAPTTTSG